MTIFVNNWSKNKKLSPASSSLLTFQAAPKISYLFRAYFLLLTGQKFQTSTLMSLDVLKSARSGNNTRGLFQKHFFTTKFACSLRKLHDPLFQKLYLRLSHTLVSKLMWLESFRSKPYDWKTMFTDTRVSSWPQKGWTAETLFSHVQHRILLMAWNGPGWVGNSVNCSSSYRTYSLLFIFLSIFLCFFSSTSCSGASAKIQGPMKLTHNM